MALQMTQTPDSDIVVSDDNQQLFRYVYRPETPLDESTKPYFHPLATRQGQIVTAFRPTDHRWHHGLAMVCAYISGQNFWGGPSYVQDQGYVWNGTNGSQRHEKLTVLDAMPTHIHLREQLSWLTHEQELWISEERTISVREELFTPMSWTLELNFSLRNVSNQTLLFGSPTTQGRQLAGYGGLFWRGPEQFLHGDIFTPQQEGTDIMGTPAPWLAYRVSATPCTLVFIDHEKNPRYPNKWFVRNDEYVGASFSFMFDEYLALPPGETLDLSYSLILADAAWQHSEIEDQVTRVRSLR